MPSLSIDPDEVINRLRELADADPCERCELPVTYAITDIARLLIQVDRLYLELGQQRLRSANLEAAVRAALGADSDGDPDPLDYLRDEIAGHSRGGVYGA